MSATNRGSHATTVADHDYYRTPRHAVEAIIPHLPDGIILDPCCGDGAILETLRDAGRPTMGMELDKSRAARARASGLHVEQRDALAEDGWPSAAIFVMNSPYHLVMQLVERAPQE